VLIDALRLVLDGGVYVPPDILTEAMSASEAAETTQPAYAAPGSAEHLEPAGREVPYASSREIESLTDRQREVLALLAQGMPTKEVCRHLGISPNTAKTHIATIFRALGVNNRAQLVAAVHRVPPRRH
jgi:DNA-binding NarL/FixJ family response regulator